MAKREFATYLHKLYERVDRKMVVTTEPWDVRVMSRAEGYAMVRRPGAMPFVVSEKDLRERETRA